MVNAVLTGGSAARTSNGFAPTTSPASRAGLENVLCPDFEFLIGLSVLALMSGCLLEGTDLGAACCAPWIGPRAVVRDNTEMMFRAGMRLLFHRNLGASAAFC